jgi:hypothetical protein
VQQHVGLVVELPLLALDLEAQALGLEVGGGVPLDLALDADQPLLDQAGANPPGAEALGLEDVLQLHPASGPKLR